MANPALTANASAFQLKAHLFPLSVLYLTASDLDSVTEQLQERVAMAPNFFQQNPVIVDLSQLPVGEAQPDFGALIRLIRRFEMIPLGIRGLPADARREAEQAGFTLLSDARPGSERRAPEPEPVSAPAPAPQPTATPTVVVEQAVRSGHQIYARGADLIVLAPVNAGAEVLADGNIHIYAPLRGRALAGASGRDDARIFCDSLEAELISIAGCYQLSDDLPPEAERRRVAIQLVEGRLQYNILNG
ncbi:MAG: septum site-determining protein MinC [Spongiibacteraceae bacterium]|jgi:septum site-determining protein MinC|nr:septum site-determining protein MinC [Spongiibacteraceae bacterium]